MVCYRSPSHWGQCRWDLKHCRSVPMIRSLSQTVCCRFASRIVTPTENLTAIQIANPFVIRFANRIVIRFATQTEIRFAIPTVTLIEIHSANRSVILTANQSRIDCQIHSVNRFVNRFATHCRLSRYHLGHSIPSYLWFLSCQMIRYPTNRYLTIHYPRNRCRMSHYRLNRCFPMALNRTSRLSLSCLSFLNCRKSRSAIHYRKNRCQMNHFQMNQTNPRIRSMVRCSVPKIPSYLTSLNYPMNQNCLTNRSIPMSQSCHSNLNCQNSRSTPSHYFPSSRSTRSIRWFLSCRFVWRSHHFHWLHCFPIRSRMNHCCHSIPRSHLNPTSQTSR
jgi:hypothetical protein